MYLYSYFKKISNHLPINYDKKLTDIIKATKCGNIVVKKKVWQNLLVHDQVGKYSSSLDMDLLTSHIHYFVVLYIL